MKVRATRLGYYKHKRRKAGEVFPLLSPDHFSELWMEKVVKLVQPEEDEKEENLEEVEESEAPIKKKVVRKKAKKKVSKASSQGTVDVNKDVL